MWLKCSSRQKDLGILVDHKLNKEKTEGGNCSRANATLTSLQCPGQGNNNPWMTALAILGTTNLQGTPVN